MEVGGFRDAKYNFWGQNGIVLELHLFFLNSAYTKPTSFWTAMVQNGVVLCCIKKKMKQRRFLSYTNETMSFRQEEVPKRGTWSDRNQNFQIVGEGGGGAGKKKRKKKLICWSLLLCSTQ